MQDSDLLQPSLDGETQIRPVYSVGALVAAAFFGGGPAVVLIAGLNSGRLARLGRDAAWLLLGLVIAVAFPLAVLHAQSGDASEEATQSLRLLARGAGFALAGAAFLLHRDAYRTMRTMGIDPPKPWIPVALAALAGIAVTVVSVAVYQAYVGGGAAQ